MSNLLVNPQYCPEDKDIVDFIHSVQVPLPELIQHLRKRGVYVSKDVTKDDLANLIGRETFAWHDVSDLLSLVTQPLQKESHITGNHHSKADIELIEQAVATVKTFRSTKYGDSVNIESLGNNSYRVHIEYTDTFFEKTRLIQCVERDAEIIIHKMPYGFKTVRSTDEVAKKVELAILGEFEKLAKDVDEKLETKRILLSQISSPTSKVTFFRALMEGLKGFNFEQIKSVRVQSVMDTTKTADGEDGDEIAEQYAAKIESLVISGKNIGETDLYDTYIGTDFVPIAATWIVSSDSDECQRAEVKAAFTVDANESELSYSVSSIWRRGEGPQPKEKPNKLVVARFATLLSESAEAAVAQANSETKNTEL